MKKILFAVSAVALALSAGSAMAADLPSRKEAPVYVPPPPPPPMWTGFYGGLNIGGGWDANGGQSGYSAYYDPRFAIGAPPPAGFANVGPNLFFLPNGNTLGSPGGVVGGAQVGYNFQFNQFVIGAETDFQGTSLSGGGNNAPLTLFPTFYGNPAGNNYLTPLEPSPAPTSACRGSAPCAAASATFSRRPCCSMARRASPMVRWTPLASATPAPAGPPAAASSGCSRRIGRRRPNISMSISPATADWRLGWNYRPQLPSAAQRRARWRELSLQLRRPGSGRRQVLIGGKPIRREARPLWPGFSFHFVGKKKPGPTAGLLV